MIRDMASEEQADQTTDSPASPTLSVTSSGRPSLSNHRRTLSMVAENGPVRTNRFSLQFPIQTSRTHSPDRITHSPVCDSSRVTPDINTADGPSEGNYLHLIAAQERRVLELREELGRAEEELNRLKVDWARHEASRKRDDARRMTRLQPLHTSFPVPDREDDSDGSSAWMQQEMERRKALLSASRSTHRKVFPGQRHTRALSLLSSGKDYTTNHQPTTIAPRPPRKDSLKNPTRQSTEELRPDDAPPTLTRSSTMGAVPAAQLDPEVLMRAGKKVATGLTDGLWTFWEDLRQATVGEESSTIHPPLRRSSTQTQNTARRQSSKGSLRDSPRNASATGQEKKLPSPGRKKSSATVPATGLADPSFWTDHGITLSQPSTHAAARKYPAAKKGKSVDSTKRASAGSNEGWDAWDDSPVQSRSSSSVTSETTTLPSTVSGSPRTSISTNRDSRDMSNKKDAIPWPALKKTGLVTLRKTASHLLTEWERSLTPSPANEFPSEDFMGASAEAAAYGAASGGGGRKGKHD